MEEAAGSWRERERAGRRTSERRPGRGERRTARSSVCPGRGGASAGGQPERAPGSPPPLGGAVPGVPPCGGRRRRRRRLSGPHGTARVLPPRPRSRRGRGALRAGPGARDRRAKEGREAAAAAAQATGRQRRRRRHHVIPQSRQEADGHGRSQAH